MIILLILLAVVEVMCILSLYYRIFYQKKHCLDTFFIVTFYIGFVVTYEIIKLI